MSPEYVSRLRKLEQFFMKGGRIDAAAKKFDVSTRTIIRMMDCLRDEGAVLTQASKAHWICSKGIFKDVESK
ncbi:MAG: hypothetical protein ABGZ35_09420 [Planctomycetaceae bacterium]